MKICFVIKNIQSIGGMERMTCYLSNILSDKDLDICIVSLKNNGKNPFFDLNDKVRIRYLNKTSNNFYSLPNCFFRKKRLREIYKEEKPDRIVFVGSNRARLNIAAAGSIPNITWEHFNVNVNNNPLHPIHRKIAARKSDCIVTLTQQDADVYLQKYKSKKVICIPNPITLHVDRISDLSSKRVLAVGRLSHGKGFDMLLDAWQRVRAREDGWSLRIVGGGRLERNLRKKIKKLNLQDSVELVSFTNNMNEEYQNASCFVISSRVEGFSLVLLEAMAFGLPVVSFDCDFGPRNIIVPNETGLLVPPCDITSLAKGLDRLLEDKKMRSEMSINARKRAELFNPNYVAEQWIKLFNSDIFE